jgi:uracil-DNA glycosylase
MPQQSSDRDALRAHQARLATCRLCLDAGYDIRSAPVVSGPPGALVMLIGQAPGRTEAETGRPFQGPSGRRLFRWLRTAGWDEETFRQRHHFAAVTRCYPGPHPSGRGDRVPTRAEQAFCRPYLDAEIRLVNPRLIITLGGLALRLFFPASRRLSDLVGLASYFPREALVPPAAFDAGRALELTAFDPALSPHGRWLVPLPHPSGASLWHNDEHNRQRLQQALAIVAAIRQHFSL